MNETPILTADYITTEHDHIYTYLAQQRFETSRGDRIIMGAVGILAIFIGLYMLIFVGEIFIKKICWILLVAIGLFLASFYEVINPSLTRIKAKNEYIANKEKFVSKNIAFYEDKVVINSDRYKGNIPYRYFFQVLEDKKVIIFYLDKNDYISIPKRLFTDKDDEALRKIESLVGKKYVRVDSWR
mgnify:CR=1 FL=1